MEIPSKSHFGIKEFMSKCDFLGLFPPTLLCCYDMEKVLHGFRITLSKHSK